ncbi:MAG: Ku protein [Xanthobacteraceae bacterium]|nr:Ku protein [Xanthobacteraceae bacterium]
MAPRANWKGYLRLSLVSCPVLLYPATSEAEKVHFHQRNKSTGNRIHLQKVDAETGEPVEAEDIVKGYDIGKGNGCVEISDEDLEAIGIESTRTIDIDSFVPRDEIDDLYINRPYYIVPDGKVGQQAFAVIREAIRKRGMVALGRLVLSTREHVVALEPRDRGIMGLLLHYPYEVRDPESYFGDIPKEDTPKEMLDLASHIIGTMTGHFQPKKFEDRYEQALRDLIKRKQAGEKLTPAKLEKPKATSNLMDALRASLEAGKRSPATSARKRVTAHTGRRASRERPHHARRRKAS